MTVYVRLPDGPSPASGGTPRAHGTWLAKPQVLVSSVPGRILQVLSPKAKQNCGHKNHPCGATLTE